MPFDATAVHRPRSFAFEAPIGWHGFKPSQLSREPYSRPTGHPPPLQQVADQVRTATGFTMGRTTTEGAAPHLLSPKGRGPDPHTAMSEPSEAPVLSGLNARVMDLLREFESDDSPLPPCRELAEFLGLPGRHAPAIAVALRHLRDLGAIRLWHGEPGSYEGQHVIRIVGSDRELRTVRAPNWAHA